MNNIIRELDGNLPPPQEAAVPVMAEDDRPVPDLVPRRGRYSSRGEDRHPPIPLSQVLQFPRSRPGRIHARIQGGAHSDHTFGDAIIYKEPGSTRFFFQNVKGLTHTTGGEDNNYFLSSMASFAVDVFGMSETNTSW